MGTLLALMSCPDAALHASPREATSSHRRGGAGNGAAANTGVAAAHAQLLAWPVQDVMTDAAFGKLLSDSLAALPALEQAPVEAAHAHAYSACGGYGGGGGSGFVGGSGACVGGGYGGGGGGGFGDAVALPGRLQALLAHSGRMVGGSPLESSNGAHHAAAAPVAASAALQADLHALNQGMAQDVELSRWLSEKIESVAAACAPFVKVWSVAAACAPFVKVWTVAATCLHIRQCQGTGARRRWMGVGVAGSSGEPSERRGGGGDHVRSRGRHGGVMGGVMGGAWV
eukprot:364932-Chlamydomonas_euryale.AAC.1